MSEDDNDNIDLPQAILETLISPNESDRNGEQANVVDGLFAIARSLGAVAASLDRMTGVLDR